MIKKGDSVIIHKPADINEYPYWAPNVGLGDIFGMDKYDGTVQVVESIYINRNILRIVGSAYRFNINWVEPVSKYEVIEDCSEDFETLL